MTKSSIHSSSDTSDCINIQDMKDYLADRLEKKEVRRIELHLSECALCSDAIDGFMESGINVSEEDLNNRIDTQIHLHKNSKQRRNNWLIAASLALICISSFYIYQNFENRNNILVHQSDQNETSKSVVEETMADDNEIGTEETASFQKEEAIQIKEPSNTVRETKSLEEDQNFMDPATNDQELFIAEDEMLEEEPSRSIQADEIQVNSNTQASAVKSQADQTIATPSAIYYIEGHKVSNTKEEREKLSAVSVKESKAKKVTKNNDAVEFSAVDVSTSTESDLYNAIMAEGLHWYRIRSYTKAVDAFDKILQRYSNDENAMFYSG
ncbi:MAG TPA: hypothetical protein PKM16_07995, partial [Bacteroidia bacterium]|nr:hypothetical protein [Bacteroidia bacterium]